MADLNVTRRDDDTVPDAALGGTAGDLRPVTDPDHLLEARTTPPHAASIAADDPELARRQIEETRSRMSQTIDQIESALVRKRERIEERLDFMAPVRQKARENVWPAVGGVFLAGLLLGYLTGEDDDDDDGAERAIIAFSPGAQQGMGDAYWRQRSETWEHRARRLMDVAHRQEEELRAFRGGSGRGAAWSDEDDDEGEEEEAPRGGFGRLRDALSSGLAAGLIDAVRNRGRRETEMELEVEVELEEDEYSRPVGEGYDGMPLRSDSHPPRDEMGGDGYGDPIQSPV